MKTAKIPLALVLLLAICCTLTSPLDIQPATAQSACDWIEYPSDPIFGQHLSGAKAYYAKVVYDPAQFSGHGDTAYYKMWFGSENGTGYAYSNDGINWTAGANPVNGLVTGANHPLVKYDPSGFGHGVYYKIWYWDPNVSIYTINALRYAESTDGINWTNDQALTQDSTSRLVTGADTGWNRGSYGPCDLIYNPSGSNTLDDSNLWNNRYVMYHMGTNGSNEYIGLAYSADGKHWKRWGNNPVLSPCDESCTSSTCWDYCSVGYCRVINIAGSWHMWYGGGPGTNHGIGYATSPDGITWTKHPDNPIFHKGDGVSWRNDRTYTPWVLYDPDNFSGHGDACPFKMWFSGKDTAGKYSIGYAAATPVDAGPDQRVCEGGSPIPLIGASPSGGTWSGTGVSDSMFDPAGLVPGDYTVTYTYTNSKGCTSSDNKTVTIDPKPSATALSNSPVCLGATIQLVGISDNTTSYHWTGPNGFTSNEQSPSIPNATPTMAGDYTLTVTSPYGCSSSTTVTVSVIPCIDMTTGGGDVSIPTTTCPISLSLNIEGHVASLNTTTDGTLCGACVARDPTGRVVFEMDDGTRLLLAGKTVPRLITFRMARTKPPAIPENTVLLGQAYEFNAYTTSYETAPLPLNISPPARLLLSYDVEDLPQNTTEIFIANYSPEQGWQPLSPPPGTVAAAGEARGLVSHFSLFAVLAKVPEPVPAKFKSSGLTINPQQVKPGQQIGVGVTVANTGEKSGVYEVELKVDGTTKATRQLTLAGGEADTVEFTCTENTPGRHLVEIAGLSSEFVVIGQAGLPAIYWWLIAAVAIAIVLVLVKLLTGR